MGLPETWEGQDPGPPHAWWNCLSDTHLGRSQHRLHEQLPEGLVAPRGQDAVLHEAHLQPQSTQVPPDRADHRHVRVEYVWTGMEGQGGQV